MNRSPREPGPDAVLGVWHARGLTAAKVALLAGTAGVLVLCLAVPRPTAAIPLFLASISLLLGAASAALFAWVAYLQLEDADPDADDDGGPGGGWDDRPGPEPPGGGGVEFDWQRFERDFRSYCERTLPAVV